MLRTAGWVLILAGVAVWGVFVVARPAGAHPVAARFLPFHPAGVIPPGGCCRAPIASGTAGQSIRRRNGDARP
jgi:hypothetical protein